MTMRPPEDDFGDDEFDLEDEDYESDLESELHPNLEEPERRMPNPPRPDPPLFAPVVFDDEDDGEERRSFRPSEGRGYESDAGLLRVLGIIAVLGLVIIALVLPWSPISVVGGGGDDGDFPAEARDLPPVPEGLTGLSRLFEVPVADEFVGRMLSVEIPLRDQQEDGSNVAIYSWDGEDWRRLAAAQLNPGGNSVTGAIPAETSTLSLAVLRRTALAHSLALVVGAGETPDPAGLASASLVAVQAASLGGEGALVPSEGALQPARQAAGDVPVYFGITGDAATAGVLASDAVVTAHVDQLVLAARAQNAGGVYLDYVGVPADQAAAFTGLVTELGQRLGQSSMGLVVAVPAGASGGYDWAALQGVADVLWVKAPLDPTAYHETVDALLSGATGVEASRVSVVLDRRSLSVGGGGEQPLTLVQALTTASVMDVTADAIGPGSPVTLRTANLAAGPGALRWDSGAYAATFTHPADGGERRVWLQNRYSFAFALDAAMRAGFGGVVVAAAGADPSHPDVWEPVAEFVEDGNVTLLRPFGPYLTPCWEASDGAVEGQPDCWTAETDTSAVVWRAPADEGAYTVRLVVSEGTTFVAQEVLLRVGEATPTPTPTTEPEEVETPEPTPEPTAGATEEPTAESTEEPTAEPTEEPTAEPTEEPTAEPTEEPTAEPTEEPEAGETPAPPTTDGPAGPGGNVDDD